MGGLQTDTIFALSSGGLPAGVAVVRISGPEALSVASSLAGTLPAPRIASLRTIRTRNGSALDTGLVLSFPGPNSFTGEDCVEFQVHGSKAVVARLMDELATFEHCRLAEQGEFTRRAMENGRLDLVEVEGLADLIAAETEMQRRLALEQASGNLSSLYAGWAERLTRGRALIEAELDFADEEDVPGSVSDRVWADMAALGLELADHLAKAHFGEIIRDGLKVVIAGAPNSGKSSLINALARRDVAIVTDIPGTTRDILHVDMNIGGFAVRLYDTAGLRETQEAIEQEGIRRALKIVSEADVVLVLSEIGLPKAVDLSSYSGAVITAGTKRDIHGSSDDYDVCISATTTEGLDRLEALILQHLRSLGDGVSMALPSRLRHRALLEETSRFVEAAVQGGNEGLDVRAENLRLAAQSIGRITGRVDIEDLLGVIFAEFCIGK